jgi:hypothetical protein
MVSHGMRAQIVSYFLNISCRPLNPLREMLHKSNTWQVQIEAHIIKYITGFQEKDLAFLLNSLEGGASVPWPNRSMTCVID